MKYRKNATVDLDIIANVACLDAENAESFKPAVQEAIKEFAERVYKSAESKGVAKAANDDAAKKKAEESMAALGKKAAHAAKAEATRQWGLTPPELRLLLPGAGSIPDTFWMQYHPYNEFFRAVYPLGHLVLLGAVQALGSGRAAWACKA